MITGKHCRYKFLWSGDNSGFRVVGILVAEKWIEKIISVDMRTSQQLSLVGRFCTSFLLMLLNLNCQSKKDNFFNLLGSISVVPSEEMLLVCGDLNAHVRKTSSGFKGIHGWHGYESEIQRALEFSNSMLQQI